MAKKITDKYSAQGLSVDSALAHLDQENKDGGGQWNTILSEFQKGRPLSDLLPLLGHRDGRVVAAGAWIASELGVRAQPVLKKVASLLQHHDKRARFWAIDCVLACASSEDGEILAATIQLSDDLDAAVRWKALSFMTSAPRDLLESGLRYLVHDGVDERHCKGVQLLVDQKPEACKLAESFLRSEDGILRGYGAVFAVRILEESEDLLDLARSSTDITIRKFANSMKRLHQKGAL